ncbi:uncharacterized protein ASCRUDRAFT_77702 [Ascoidea rubescens DSM 1968]|uniref:Uncharacterized protein n=1 Tax=Ascoidea rubescens DSM 1968 TaxID=1344418 RepID=A0A1D2VAK0_9ASCO|nr:hypothetical protein ASCRUDRAFT_77702 [Ascoidea rubescens DSM 1968]ODV58698.1 hypothetical protein ASCRUDRAFT_77702 [Ascoidea rubescens DSM 1968]
MIGNNIININNTASNDNFKLNLLFKSLNCLTLMSIFCFASLKDLIKAEILPFLKTYLPNELLSNHSSKISLNILNSYVILMLFNCNDQSQTQNQVSNYLDIVNEITFLISLKDLLIISLNIQDNLMLKSLIAKNLVSVINSISALLTLIKDFGDLNNLIYMNFTDFLIDIESISPSNDNVIINNLNNEIIKSFAQLIALSYELWHYDENQDFDDTQGPYPNDLSMLLTRLVDDFKIFFPSINQNYVVKSENDLIIEEVLFSIKCFATNSIRRTIEKKGAIFEKFSLLSNDRLVKNTLSVFENLSQIIKIKSWHNYIRLYYLKCLLGSFESRNNSLNFNLFNNNNFKSFLSNSIINNSIVTKENFRTNNNVNNFNNFNINYDNSNDDHDSNSILTINLVSSIEQPNRDLQICIASIFIRKLNITKFDKKTGKLLRRIYIPGLGWFCRKKLEQNRQI